MLSNKQQSARKTGIDLLGDVPWGSHFCLFYETEEDLIDILVPYFKTGLESNELCMWVTSEPLNEKKAKDTLREVIPNFDRYLRKEQILIVPDSEWYLKDNVFNMQRVLNAWADQLNQALSSGFAGMRVTGNMSGFEKEDWRKVADYEREVNEAIGKYRMLAICSYCIDECRTSEIIDVVSCHQSAIIRRKGKWEVIESGERKKMENVLKESEQKFETIFDSAIDGILLADLENKKFLMGNKTICQKLGYSQKEIKNLGVMDIHPKKDIPYVVDQFEIQVKKGFALAKDIPVKRRDGSVFYADVNSALITLAGKRYLVGIFRDITERKQTEEALQASEKKYRTLLENLPQKIFLKDKDSVYISCNKNYAKDLKIKAKDIAGKKDYDFFPEELAHKYRADDKRVIKSGKTEDINEKYIREGKEVIVHTVKTPMRDKQGNVTGILGIFWDITSQRRAQKKLLDYQKLLRDLTSEMSLTEERERRRLAIELHDQITQKLILFKINLGSLRQKELPTELSKPLDEIYEDINEIIQDTRSLTFDLGSPTLYELGLEAAIREWLNEEVQQKHGIKTEFEDDGQSKPLDDDVCALLYRAVRELLVNVIKHAKARNVKVSICTEKNNICINVIDDGIGFISPIENFTSNKAGGFGLFSIRERLTYLGGSIEIDSKPNQGTRVTLAAPIKRKKHN